MVCTTWWVYKLHHKRLIFQIKMNCHRTLFESIRGNMMKLSSFFHNQFLFILIFGFSLSVTAEEKETPTSCRDLTSPKNQNEVNELLTCIRKINQERNSQKDLLKIQNKFTSSEQLSGQINSSSSASGIKKTTPMKQSGKYPGSVALSNQIQSSFPGAGMKKLYSSGLGNNKKGKTGIYPGSVELTQKIQTRNPSTGKKVSATSLIENNPELSGPKSFSESKQLAERIKSRLD